VRDTFYPQIVIPVPKASEILQAHVTQQKELPLPDLG
jgi:hypothetical protein